MSDHVLELTDVSKSFRGRPVLQGVSFALAENSSVALTGPNGSGKSVLLRLCTRLMSPDAGTAWIRPDLLASGAMFPSSFGVIIDRPGFIPNLSGYENLSRLAKIRGAIGPDEIKGAMARVGLEPDLRTPAGKYSLGMRQKLSLAQAFMEDQRVLLLDEPFNGLDRESVQSVHGLLRDLLAEGRTLLFTSHQQSDVEALAQRRLEIVGGKVEEIAVDA